MINRDFSACSKQCKYFEKPLPTYLPTPTCRLFEKYDATKNVVTKSVFRDIIRKRIRCEFVKD